MFFVNKGLKDFCDYNKQSKLLLSLLRYNNYSCKSYYGTSSNKNNFYFLSNFFDFKGSSNGFALRNDMNINIKSRCLTSSAVSSSSSYSFLNKSEQEKIRAQKISKVYEEISQEEKGLNINDNSGKTTGINPNSLSNLDKFKLYALSRTGIIIGGGILSFFVAEIIIKLSGEFLRLDFETVGMMGFVTGFISCGATLGLMYLGWRITFIRPGGVFNDTLQLLRENKQVCDLLGVTNLTPIRAGTIRAYQIHKGGLGFVSPGKLGWIHPQIDMMFQVYGPSDQAIVICQSRKVGGRRIHDFVSVESVTRQDTPILILVGDESKMKIRKELQEFVTLNKMYVNSNISDKDNKQ